MAGFVFMLVAPTVFEGETDGNPPPLRSTPLHSLDEKGARVICS
jgi:hypothetical protein